MMKQSKNLKWLVICESIYVVHAKAIKAIVQSDIWANRFCSKKWEKMDCMEDGLHVHHRQMWFSIAIFAFNEPHSCIPVPAPRINKGQIPPHQCHRILVASVCEWKKEESLCDNIAGHRELHISSVACVHQDCVLLWGTFSPLQRWLNPFSTKTMYARWITGSKENWCCGCVYIYLPVERPEGRDGHIRVGGIRVVLGLIMEEPLYEIRQFRYIGIPRNVRYHALVGWNSC